MIALVWQTGVASACFALSAIFAAAETALLSLSRPRLKKLIVQRPELAHAFTEWLASPQYLLTTILVGATLCNVAVSLVVTNIFITVLPSIRRGLVEAGAWLFLTIFMFMFADFIPKSLARHYPQRVAISCLRWISGLTRALTPLIRFMLKGFEKLFPTLEGAPVGRLTVYTIEEVREMIRAGAAEGHVERRSMQMMERVLALNRISVSQIMSPFEKVEMVNLEKDLETILDQVAEAGRTRVAAFRGNPRRIVGYLHVKDLLLAWRGVLPLKLDMLLRQPLFVPPSRTAGELLEEFRKGLSHLAIIVNPEGEAQGIVTLEDVLEEVVGEILDEYDLENPRGVR